jgi:carboxypeptidase C (cathepsin A)
MKTTFWLLVSVMWVIPLFPTKADPVVGEEAHSSPSPRYFASDHKAMIGGRVIHYRATMAEQFVVDATGKRLASVFTTSYERTDRPKGEIRPILFAFNGGPGSSSMWLHLGLIGPRRVDFDDPAKPNTLPPFPTIDNPDSPLDVADLVLIDPPGTGFSTILPDGKPNQFYVSKADAVATANVIRDWIDRHDRWNAPKYILGESYGTIRAALVARLLAGGPTETGNLDGVALNGLILVGQALDLNQLGDRHFVTSLPTLAATACYLGKIKTPCTPLGQASSARSFADEEYVRALYQGARLDSALRAQLADRLSALIGIPADVIAAHDLRIDNDEFAKLLLANQGKEIGMFDARFTLPSKTSGHDPVADDPAMGQYSPGYVAAFNHYLRDELGVRIDAPYKAVSFRDVEGQWDYGDGPGVPLNKNFAPDLAVAMRRNPALRVMVGSGLYDLVTTVGDADYTLAHAGVPLDRVSLRQYPSGHMAYLGRDARQQLAADLRTFVAAQPRP